MTNSPPVNVHNKDNTSPDPYTILASGIDTLYLNYSLSWESMNFLNKLKESREEAKLTQDPVVLEMQTDVPAESCILTVKHHGSSGYAYLLTSDEYDMRFVHVDEDSSDNSTRPPVNVRFRSALLHGMGAKAAEYRLQHLLTSAGGDIHSRHVSRVDLFVDILLPESEWGDFIKPSLVCRAKYKSNHYDGDLFTGISIGRGAISARIYDKPQEIRKSGKQWMYDIWKIDAVPEGMRIARVEFQLEREKVKELGIDTFIDLKAYAHQLWAYCTQKWLKAMDCPDKHTTRRNVLLWWQAVQDGFLGLPAGEPLIAARQISADKKRAYRNLIGYASSYFAADNRNNPLTLENANKVAGLLRSFIPELEIEGFAGENLLQLVKDKCSRYNRSAEKYSQAMEAREEAYSYTDSWDAIDDIPF